VDCLSDPPLTDDAALVIRNSIRASTRKSYLVHWRSYTAYCVDHKLKIFACSVNQFVNFLSFLHTSKHLSVASILVARSAILSFLTDPVSDKLSKSRTVKRFLTGLEKMNPRLAKLPIWILDDAIAHLDRYFFDYQSAYEVGCHLATILLLFSGHRVSELSFLAVDKDHMFMNDDSITFQPLHGTKTDTAKRISVPWTFPDNDIWRLCVKHIVTMYQMLTIPHRGSCDSLFVDTTQVGVPLSVAQLRNYVGRTLPKLGVLSTPGSCRPALATAHLLSGSNIDELLVRGLWRCSDTVRNHYFRP
jgi:hypothetical protein